MLLLLGNGLEASITNFKYAFPKHIINLLFIISSFIIYPLFLFNNKKLNYIGLIISIIIMIIFGFKPTINPSTYDTSIKCSDENIIFDNTYKAYLEDSKYGNLKIKYNNSIESYCINASFKKQGDTKVILEDSNGNKKYYNIHIGKMTYSLEGFE